MPNPDEFVFPVSIHTIFRGLALFIVAPILLYKGKRSDDRILTFLGLATLIVDGITFTRAIKEGHTDINPFL